MKILDTIYLKSVYKYLFKFSRELLLYRFYFFSRRNKFVDRGVSV